MSEPELLIADAVNFPSLAARPGTTKKILKLALIQDFWHGDETKQIDSYFELIALLEGLEPDLIVFPELTLSAYSCYLKPEDNESFVAETIETGSTLQFARSVAKKANAAVVVSLYERASSKTAYNTAILIDKHGELKSKTRKKHLPITNGYFEDQYFSEGNDNFDVTDIKDISVGIPTCWDQWFPELARIYGLKDTDLIVYPTAIGSEPDFPNFETKTIWQKMIVSHGIANGLFVAAANRIGVEGPLTFYGSSFISDPFGRVWVEASKDTRSALFAEIDVSQGEDWLTLFPFFKTRRPSIYGQLTNRA